MSQAWRLTEHISICLISLIDNAVRMILPPSSQWDSSPHRPFAIQCERIK